MAPSIGSSSTVSDSTRGLCLLSLDGGLSGIPVLKTLKSVASHIHEEENRLRSIRGQPEQLVYRKPCEYFDMIAGSGSGGIIALMIGPLGMGVDEAIDSYCLILDRVSASPANNHGEAVPQERSNALENELKRLIASRSGDSGVPLLKDEAETSTCKTFVCTRNEHNLNASIPVILRSYDCVHSVHKGCMIWEAARATSATPGTFSPTLIGRLGPFVGGAWGCSNPTQILLEEAAREFPGRRIASLISIGTGHPKTISLTNSALTEVAKQIAVDCEGVHERMLRVFANQKNVYHRFNVEQGLQMTDRDQLNDSAEVEAHTDAYLSSAAVQLALPELAKVIVQAVGKVDPNHLLRAPPSLPKSNRLLIRPPPPSRVFAGRKDIVESIEASLLLAPGVNPPHGQKRFVLHGLGGSGKTQIALEFIRLHSLRFTKQYLINASSENAIMTALENVGLDLGLPEPTASDALDLFCRLNEEWLLLYDGADDPSINLHKFFPPCGHGSILVTSRNQQSNNYSQPCTAAREVHGMTPEDSVSLLTSLTSRKSLDTENVALLPTIAEMLGYLALALVQCGSYVAVSPGMTFRRYMDTFKRRRRDLLHRRLNTSVDLYDHTVYTTWAISFEALSDPAKSLLNVCSFFHLDGITTEIFSRAALNATRDQRLHEACFSPGLEFLNQFSTIVTDAPDSKREDEIETQGFDVGEAVWDDLNLSNTMTELTSYSLMQHSLEGSLSIHPLVQSWCQDRDNHGANLHAAQVVLALSVDDKETEDSSIHRQFLLPHLTAILAVSSSFKMNSTVAMRVADALRLVGRYNASERLWSDIVEEQTIRLGREHPGTLTSMNNLAVSHSHQGQHNQAEIIHSEVLEIRKRIMGSTHPDTLTSMNNLALSYSQQGRDKEAEVIQLEVLEIRKRILGATHPNTLTSMSNLALSYSQQGRHNDAQVIQSEVLESQKRVLGLTHPDTLMSMSNLGTTYLQQGRHKEAETIQWDVLQIRKRVLGSTHPDTLKVTSNLALTYSQQGRQKDAEVLQSEVLEIQKWMLGLVHPDTLMSMNNLAFAYSQQGRHDDAEVLQSEVLELQKRVLGPTHPYTLTSMNNLAITYSHHGKLDEAAALMTEAVKGLQERLGAEHPDTLSSMKSLDFMQRKLSHQVLPVEHAQSPPDTALDKRDHKWRRIFTKTSITRNRGTQTEAPPSNTFRIVSSIECERLGEHRAHIGLALRRNVSSMHTIMSEFPSFL